MPASKQRTILLIATIASILTGCNDDRVASLAVESAERQARQSEATTELNKEIASGARNLVTADSAAGVKILAVHRDLQAERARLDAGWTDLEHERQQIAGERAAATLLLPAASILGATILVVTALTFCWCALARARSAEVGDAELNELLIESFVIGGRHMAPDATLGGPAVDGASPRQQLAAR